MDLVICKEESQIAALEEMLEYGASPALEHFLSLTGMVDVDYSEEGIIDRIKEVIKVIFHKMYIAINRAWANLTKANQEVKDAIDDVANRPDADTSKLPISKKQAAAMGVVLSAAAAILGIMACRDQYSRYKNRQEEKRIREEEKAARLAKEHRLEHYKSQMKQGLRTMYKGTIRTGKFLNKQGKDIEEAAAGFSRTARLVSGSCDYVIERGDDLNRALNARRNRANPDDPRVLSETHGLSALAQKYTLPALNSASKVAKFFTGQLRKDRIKEFTDR